MSVMPPYPVFPWISPTPEGTKEQVITIALEQPAGADYRMTEIVIMDRTETPRESFAAGEEVWCDIHYTNVGAGTQPGRIVIYDEDTGEEVIRVGLEIINPGESSRTGPFRLGRMPNRDWTLRFVAEEM